MTGDNGCKAFFAIGAAPAGWTFDRDYAGGGPVLPFRSGGQSGILMTYHGEIHWRSTAPTGPLCNNVPCFYGALGLALSLDQGQTFTSVGQIIQPYQPLAYFKGGGNNMPIGYGPIVVADISGHPIANPGTADPNTAYLYVFFPDLDPAGPGGCAGAPCLAVARARLSDLLAAALPPGNPSAVASVFKKYDTGGTDIWSQPGTSGSPDESGLSGHFTPLFTDDHPTAPTVTYDSYAGAYLLGYMTRPDVKIRSSTDLLHWSAPIATYAEAGNIVFYPSLIGEGSDPLLGGASPRLFYTSFVTFPDWGTSAFKNVTVSLTLSH